MRKLRPVVETGYENVLLCRLLLEEKRVSDTSAQGTRGLTVNEIIENCVGREKPWYQGCLSHFQFLRYGCPSKEWLIEAFGTSRDDWMQNDMPSWLGANAFYDGVCQAVASRIDDVYIITTKQQTRFAKALLDHGMTLNGLDARVSEERIFGLGTGPKAEVLAMLQEKHAPTPIHFVEDRVETLEGICKDSRLNDVNLYLCDWGFNTHAQRERADQASRIELIGQERFRALMSK
ncbi:unnamed protein product [Chrysoparadoxa australica]